MATVRIQLRRGEYQDWYDANPQLAAGELAIETDTNRIKIGDGSTNWRNLDYAIVNNDGTPLTTDDYGQPDGVPQLDASGYIKAQNLPPLAKITVHSVANQAARLALTVEPGDIAIQSDNGTSYVLQSTPASTNANWKELTATQAINDAVNAAVTAMLDGAPGALNTLNELAAAIGDDPAFFTTVATNLSNHENDSTNVHGIADTALLATKAYADQAEADAISTAAADATSKANAAQAAAEATAAAALSNHESDTTNIHGIADTSILVTTTGNQTLTSKTLTSPNITGIPTAPTAAAGTDSTQIATTEFVQDAIELVVGAAPSALNTLSEIATSLNNDADLAGSLTSSISTKVSKSGDTMTGSLTLFGNPQGALHAANKSYVDNLVTGAEATALNNLNGHNDTIYNVHGIADTSLLATKAYADNVGTNAGTALSNHNSDTTNVHGIADTSDLATGTALGAHIDDTTSVHGITDTANLVYTDDARLSNTRTPTNNTVSTEKIVALAVTTAKIDDLSVTSDKLAANSVTTEKITDTSVTSDKLAGDSVTTVKITDLNVTTDKIANDAVTSDKIADSAVAAAQLASLAVETAKINDLAVTTAKIDDLSVTSYKLAADSVTTSKIVDTSVTTDKIANDAVTSDKIADSAVAAAQLASLAVETAKINDLAVTTAKIDDGAVTSAKIANGTIVNADINASAEIEQSKIANLLSDLGSKAPSANPTFTGTVTLPGTTAIGNVSSTELGYLDGVTSGIQAQIDTKLASATAASTYAPIASPTFTGTVVLPSTTSVGNVSSTELGYLDGVTSAVQTQIDAKADSSTVTSHTSATTSVHGISDTSQLAYKNAANQTFTGNLEVDGNMTVDGNLTVNGTTFNASSTSIVIEDNMVQLAHQNVANTVDLGLVVGYTDGTAKHAGIVRDVSDSKWKIFKDVADEPSTTVNFGQGSLDNLAVNNVEVAGVVFTDGTQTKEGVPSRTTVDSKTADYTLVLTDRDKMIEVNSSSALTISIPTDASVNFPVGTSIDLLRVGSGAVTIAAVTPATTTLNFTPGNKLRAQWSSATLFKRAANTWVLMGDLTA